MHNPAAYHITPVLTLYTRGGGKTAVNSWVASVANIGLISYVCVQLFEQVLHRQFRGILHSMAAHQTLSFAHLSSDCIITRLPGTQVLSDDKRTLTVDQVTLTTYLQLHDPTTHRRILDSVKILIKARRKRQSSDDVPEE